MPAMDVLRPIVILGPTAGGKSELAVRLAMQLQGQVISADSMQVYRHMDVGTAKPSLEQRQRVVHHMIDAVEPTERFTVSDWLEAAEAIMARLQGQGIRPIVVGGTNLYIKALLEGMFEGPDHDPQLRQQLEGMDLSSLHARLARVDPAAAQRIHPNDRRKMTRAIEVHALTGQPISAQQTQWDAADRPDGGYRHDPILIGLHWPAEAINPRINLRVKAMFYPQKVDGNLLDQLNIRQSLVEEVRDLTSRHLLGPQAGQALGYKQVLAHLAGEMSLEDAYEKTRVLTRRFAKTQRTWLRRYQAVRWLDGASLGAEEAACQAAQYVSGVK